MGEEIPLFTQPRRSHRDCHSRGLYRRHSRHRGTTHPDHFARRRRYARRPPRPPRLPCRNRCDWRGGLDRGMSNFVHLHVHSEHSGLDSTARVRDLVRTAARMGQPAVAITDHGTLAGIYDAIDEGKKQGVKVIAGLEAYLAIGSRHEQNFIEVPGDDFDTDAGDEREGRMKRKRYHHITVLAKSATGWRNLVAMHNASADSMWGKHRRIDYDLLKEHSEDLIVLTGCLGGPVLGPMASGDEEGARKGLEALIDAVGHSNVYVEIMQHGIPQETEALRGMAKLAREYDLP